jgi:NADPH2:quinone reductase
VTTLTSLLEHDALVHNVAERLPLEQIAQAHELVEQGRAVGNVVLAIP